MAIAAIDISSGWEFPDQNIPNDKKDADYIAKYLMAIHKRWSTYPTMSYGAGNVPIAGSWNIFAAPWEAQQLRDYARGLNNNDQLRQIYQLNEQGGNASTSAMNISWDTSKVQWKVMNAVSHFMTARDTEIIAYAIDPVSVEKRTRERYDKIARMALAKNPQIAELNAAMGVDMPIPEDAPQTEEELDIHEAMGPKDEQTLTLTNAVRLMDNKSNYQRVARPRVAEELRDIGIVFVMVEIGDDGIPREKVVPIERCVVPWSEDGQFRNIPYAGYIEFMTPAKIIQRRGGATEDERKMLYDMAKNPVSDGRTYGVGAIGYQIKGTLPVFTGFFKDSNFLEIGSKKGRNGKNVYKEGAPEKRWRNESKTIEVVYQGSFVIGTYQGTIQDGADKKNTPIYWNCGLVYNMPRDRGGKIYEINGEKDYPNLYQTELPVVIRAYNMTMMRTMSIARIVRSKAIEIEELYIHLRNVINNIIPPGLGEYDIDALKATLEDLDLPSTTKMTFLLRMFKQTGSIAVKRSDPDVTGSIEPIHRAPVVNPNAGYIGDLERLWNSIDRAKQELYETIGLNDATLGNTTSDRQSIGGLKIQAQGSATSLGFLFQTFDDVEESVSMLKYRLLQCSMRNGTELKGIPRLFGDPAMKWLKFSAEDDPGEIGIEVRAQLTDEDKVQINEALQSAVVNGMITPVEKALVLRYKNFDQAMRMLNAIMKRKEKEAHSRSMEMTQAQQQGSIQSANIMKEAQAEQLSAKIQAESQLLNVKSQMKMAELDKAAQLEESINAHRIAAEATKQQVELMARMDELMAKLESQERISRENNASKESIEAAHNETSEEIAGKESSEESTEK